MSNKAPLVSLRFSADVHACVALAERMREILAHAYGLPCLGAN